MFYRKSSSNKKRKNPASNDGIFLSVSHSQPIVKQRIEQMGVNGRNL